MLLMVHVDGRPYVVDVGFGGLTLTAPLRLQVDVEQRTPHETFRLLASGDAFVMQARTHSTWRSLYQFDLQEQFLPDYEVTNWYLSNHPAAHFVTGLIAARADRDRRYALRGGELALHHIDGTTERRTLTTAAELRTALKGTFGLTLPFGADIDAALERVIPRAA